MRKVLLGFQVAPFGYYLLGNDLIYMIDEIIPCFISIFFELFEVQLGQLSLRLKKSKANETPLAIPSLHPPFNPCHPRNKSPDILQASYELSPSLDRDQCCRVFRQLWGTYVDIPLLPPLKPSSFRDEDWCVGSGNLVEVYEWKSRAVYGYCSGGFDVDFWEVGTGGGWAFEGGSGSDKIV